MEIRPLNLLRAPKRTVKGRLKGKRIVLSTTVREKGTKEGYEGGEYAAKACRFKRGRSTVGGGDKKGGVVPRLGSKRGTL